MQLSKEKKELLDNARTFYRQSKSIEAKSTIYGIVSGLLHVLLIIGLVGAVSGLPEELLVPFLGGGLVVALIGGLPTALIARFYKKNAKQLMGKAIEICDKNPDIKEAWNISVKHEKKDKKVFYFIVILIFALLALFSTFGPSESDKRKDRAQDLMNSDPNSWTEDDKAFIDDYYGSVLENN